jgi:hypothetical protein
MSPETKIPVFTSSSTDFGRRTPSFPDVVDMETKTVGQAHELATRPVPTSMGQGEAAPKPIPVKNGEVITYKFDPRVIQEALKLCGNDRSKLVYGTDGSILVKN